MTRSYASFSTRAALRAVFFAAASLAVALPANAQSSTTDPRAGLKPGLYDAGVASRGLQLVAHRNKQSSAERRVGKDRRSRWSRYN